MMVRRLRTFHKIEILFIINNISKQSTNSSKMSTFFIRHVTSNVNQDLIKNTFAKLDLGTVESTEFIKHRHGRGRSVYIHFSKWNVENPAAKNIQDQLTEGRRDVAIVYDDPHFWKLELITPFHITNAQMSNKTMTIEFEKDAPVGTFSLGENEDYVVQLEAELAKARNYIDSLESDVIDLHLALDESTQRTALAEQNAFAWSAWFNSQHVPSDFMPLDQFVV